MNEMLGAFYKLLSLMLFLATGRIFELWTSDAEGERTMKFLYTYRRQRFIGYDNTTVVPWRVRLLGDGWSGRYVLVDDKIRTAAVPALVRQFHNTTGELFSSFAGVRLEEYSRDMSIGSALYMLAVFYLTNVTSFLFLRWLARGLLDYALLFVFLAVFAMDLAVPVYPRE